MKIAMVSEHASPLAMAGGVDSGGQNVHVAALSAALARRGHDVRVFTRRDDPELPDVVPIDGYLVEHVPAGPAEPVAKDELAGYMPEFGEILAQRWTEETPAIAHGHFWMSGLACSIATGRVDIPVVQTFHALGVVKQRHQGDKDTSPAGRIQVEEALCASVDRVIATCMDEVFELRAMGLPLDRTSIVPCGVDLDRFAPAGKPSSLRGTSSSLPSHPIALRDGPSAARGESGAPGSKPGDDSPLLRLLVVSRLVERKGIDDVILAMTELPEAELVVAGGPPHAAFGDDPEACRLMQIAEFLGISHRVRFLGQVRRQHMPELIASADIVVTAPWYEPFGIVPLEAMACGRPVVATSVGGLVDSVVDGVTGVLVPPRRPRALANALRRLIDDEELRTAYGLAGRKRAESRFGWDRIASLTESAYLTTIEQRSARMSRKSGAVR